MPEIPRIGLDLDPSGRVVISPQDFLGRPVFATFRAVCAQHGARYDHEAKASIIQPDMVPGLAEGLRKSGLRPLVSPALAALLLGRAQEARSAQEAATARLGSLAAHLAARGLALYPFQMVGVAWLEGRRSALLCEEMGLGKTIESAMAITQDPAARTIVLCPASLKGNWARELGIWRPELMPLVLSGRGSFTWPQPGQVVILNPDILPKVEEEDAEGAVHRVNPFEDCPQGIDLVVDECHQYKGGTKTKRGKTLRALGRACRKAGGRTWGLTGTPLLSRPDDLYALLTAFDLLKETFGDWPGFLRAWGAKPGYWGGQEWGDPSPSVAVALKRVMLRRRREEVLPDLPTKTRGVIPVEIDKKTRTLCEAARAAIEASGISLAQMVEEGKVSGAAFEQIARTRGALASAKIPAMMELLDEYEQENEAVVVFCYHRAPIEALAHRKGWAWFTGETPPAERTELVRRFQAGEFKGLGATIGAGGVGHTMTKAHHALFVDLDWTPALNCQAEDRLCRIGQDRGVIIRILEAPDTIDQDVNTILLRKQRMIDGAIEQAAAKPAEVPCAVRPEELEAAAADVGRVVIRNTAKRGPRGTDDERVKGCLLALAGCHGFSDKDKGFGESLAGQLQSSGELSDRQWTFAALLCKNYEELYKCQE